jgi:hypothetical protein
VEPLPSYFRLVPKAKVRAEYVPNKENRQMCSYLSNVKLAGQLRQIPWKVFDCISVLRMRMQQQTGRGKRDTTGFLSRVPGPRSCCKNPFRLFDVVVAQSTVYTRAL